MVDRLDEAIGALVDIATGYADELRGASGVSESEYVAAQKKLAAASQAIRDAAREVGVGSAGERSTRDDPATVPPDLAALLREAEALCAGASEPDWTLEPSSSGGAILVRGNHREAQHRHPQTHLQVVPAGDAQFIARARSLIPELAAALRRQEELVERRDFALPYRDWHVIYRALTGAPDAEYPHRHYAEDRARIAAHIQWLMQRFQPAIEGAARATEGTA